MSVLKPVRRFFSNDKELILAIKNVFGFYPENIFLYKQAFLHRSAAIEVKDGVKLSNERLEFLGDAILDAIIADFLFKKFPYKDEGYLTQIRSRIVSRETLSQLGKKLNLDSFIQLSPDLKSPPPTVLGNALEALIGAVYIDKGYDFCKNLTIDRILKSHLNLEEVIATDKNYKSQLIEWGQSLKKEIVFEMDGIKSNKKSRLYQVSVVINGKTIARGEDRSIKKAEQHASKNALIELEILK